MSWIEEILQKPSIPNEFPHWIHETFSKHPICLHRYWCVCIGIIEGKRHFTYLRLIARLNQLLEGVHYLQGIAPESRWVHSLTCLRKDILKYEDRLSFERSTFLIYEEGKKLLRLKSIRSYLLLPVETINEQTPIYVNPTEYYFQTSNIQFQPRMISQRTLKQLQNYLHILTTAYVRELGIPINIAQEMLHQRIQKELSPR